MEGRERISEASRRARAAPREDFPRLLAVLRDEAVRRDAQSWTLVDPRRSATRLRERGVGGASGRSVALARALARPVDLLRGCVLDFCLCLPVDTLLAKPGTVALSFASLIQVMSLKARGR